MIPPLTLPIFFHQDTRVSISYFKYGCKGQVHSRANIFLHAERHHHDLVVLLIRLHCTTDAFPVDSLKAFIDLTPLQLVYFFLSRLGNADNFTNHQPQLAQISKPISEYSGTLTEGIVRF